MAIFAYRFRASGTYLSDIFFPSLNFGAVQSYIGSVGNTSGMRYKYTITNTGSNTVLQEHRRLATFIEIQ